MEKSHPGWVRSPTPADRAIRLGGVPHFSCKHSKGKRRDYLERPGTSPSRGTSPTWGPLLPCKQALITLTNHNRNKTQMQVISAKRGKTRASKSRLVLVLRLIG